MDRKSRAVEVLVEDGEIRIQSGSAVSPDSFVFITADQAELLCSWIMDAAREIQQQRNQ